MAGPAANRRHCRSGLPAANPDGRGDTKPPCRRHPARHRTTCIYGLARRDGARPRPVTTAGTAQRHRLARLADRHEPSRRDRSGRRRHRADLPDRDLRLHPHARLAAEGKFLFT